MAEKPDDAPEETPEKLDIVIPAEQLFGEEREVCIELHGERYRLRITRRGKLILVK